MNIVRLSNGLLFKWCSEKQKKISIHKSSAKSSKEWRMPQKSSFIKKKSFVSFIYLLLNFLFLIKSKLRMEKIIKILIIKKKRDYLNWKYLNCCKSRKRKKSKANYIELRGRCVCSPFDWLLLLQLENDFLNRHLQNSIFWRNQNQ